MNGMLVINNLAGLLVVTALLVIGTQKVVASARWYALQSLLLVLIFIALATTQHSPELYWWGLSAFITKVLLVPFIMVRALGKLSDEEGLKSVLHPAWMIIIAAIIMLLSWYAVSSVHLAVVAELKPALAVSLGHFLLGLLCIVSQRNILKQIFGYCLMENGAHLTLALLASKAPEVVEIGIATDAIFAVLIMALLARRIYHSLHTLDARQLTALKG